mmetsp:Transcript_45614/g.68801  ORF Transcript_45614/g.68801 Transcript_45614/m.68801 type:complete len:164 (+) Transcript_45614:112-603(+)
MKIRVSTIRVILLSHHVFQYLLIPWYLTNLQNHTTCAFFGVDALSMSLKQNRITDRENGNPTARRNIKGKKENTSGKKHNRISNKSTVDALALKIGLNVVPAAAPSKLNLNTNRNTRQGNKSEKKAETQFHHYYARFTVRRTRTYKCANNRMGGQCKTLLLGV